MSNFVEINEVSTYKYCPKSKKGTTEESESYRKIILGKILINTDMIRCVSIASWRWKDEEQLEINPDSIEYCVYFDKDRYVYTDIESYNKIKEFVINTQKDIIYE